MTRQRIDVISTKHDMLERTDEYNRGHALAMEVAETTEVVDPFDDDTPLTCGTENPEICESCT